MKKKIIFQKCNFNYIYFLFYIIAFIIMLIIDVFLDPSDIKENSENKDLDNFDYEISKQILEIFILNISDFIGIIPYLIRKKLLQSKSDGENIERTESIRLIYNALLDSKKKKKILFYFILIAAFDFLKDFVIFLYYLIQKDRENDNTILFSHAIIFDIILQFVCSYLILGIQFYKLQRFSLYLNVAICLIILVFDLVDILVVKLTKGYIYIIYPFYLTFFCLEYVFGKKVILFEYISVYILIIMKGIIKIVFNVIFSIVILIVKKRFFIAFAQYFSKPKYIFLVIGKIIVNFFYGLFLWIIIDRFSPNHTPLIIIGEEICNFVIDLIITKKFMKMKGYKYVRIILYIFSFIGVLLHNEIIVINICGLGSDTKYFLDTRLKSEEEYTTSDDPNILKRFETLEMIEYTDDSSVTN